MPCPASVNTSGVNTLRVNCALKGGVPDVLHRPQSADKKADPRQGFVLRDIGVGLPQALLSDPCQDGVLQHNNHQESIEKNHKWKNKI